MKVLNGLTAVLLNYKRSGRSRSQNAVYYHLMLQTVEDYDVYFTKKWLDSLDLGPGVELLMETSKVFGWIDWN